MNIRFCLLLQQCVGSNKIACKIILEIGFTKLFNLFESLSEEKQKNAMNYAIEYAIACTAHEDAISSKIILEAFESLSNFNPIDALDFIIACLNGKNHVCKEVIEKALSFFISATNHQVEWYENALIFLSYLTDKSFIQGQELITNALSQSNAQDWLTARENLKNDHSALNHTNFQKSINFILNLELEVKKINNSQEIGKTTTISLKQEGIDEDVNAGVPEETQDIPNEDVEDDHHQIIKDNNK